MKSLIKIALGAAGLAASIALPVSAQQYPTKPVTVVYPVPPGSIDIYLRAIQKPMEQELGQTLVLDSKPGANGYIGARQVAQAAPDGYNLLLSVSGSVVIGPLTSANAGFDTRRDFEPVIGLIMGPLALVVRSSLNINSFAELIDYAKKNPGKMTYGTTGSGSLPHIYFETIARLAGTPLTHVPYRGFPPMMQAVLGGEVDMVFVTIGLAKEQVAAGKLKAIAVDDGAKLGTLTGVPDIGKVLPGFETIPVFVGLWAPAKTPKPVIEKLNRAANAGLANPEGRKAIEQNGSNAVIGGTPDQFAKIVDANVAVTAKLVTAAKAAGMKLED